VSQRIDPIHGIDPKVRARWVAHLAERLQDDGLLHMRYGTGMRGRCWICEAIMHMEIGEQLQLVHDAAELARLTA